MTLTCTDGFQVATALQQVCCEQTTPKVDHILSLPSTLHLSLPFDEIPWRKRKREKIRQGVAQNLAVWLQNVHVEITKLRHDLSTRTCSTKDMVNTARHNSCISKAQARQPTTRVRKTVGNIRRHHNRAKRLNTRTDRFKDCAPFGAYRQPVTAGQVGIHPCTRMSVNCNADAQRLWACCTYELFSTLDPEYTLPSVASKAAPTRKFE